MVSVTGPSQGRPPRAVVKTEPGTEKPSAVKSEPGLKPVGSLKEEKDERDGDETPKSGRLYPRKTRGKSKKVAFAGDYRRKNWAKRLVWVGKKTRTSGGLQRHNLMRNKTGRIVSKRVSEAAKRAYYDNHLDLWNRAFMELRAEKGITGFVTPKKAGTRFQRRLWKDIQKCWVDKVAVRVVKMFKNQPELVGKIPQRLGSKNLLSQFIPSELAMAAAAKASPAAAAAHVHVD